MFLPLSCLHPSLAPMFKSLPMLLAWGGDQSCGAELGSHQQQGQGSRYASAKGCFLGTAKGQWLLVWEEPLQLMEPDSRFASAPGKP